MWDDMEYDVAKTVFAMRNLFRVAEMAYLKQHPEESALDLDLLMSVVKSEVIISRL